MVKFPEDYPEKSDLELLFKKIEEKYSLKIAEKVIGMGGYGFVVEATKAGHVKPIALKVSKNEDQDCSDFPLFKKINDLHLLQTIHFYALHSLTMTKNVHQPTTTTSFVLQNTLSKDNVKEVNSYYCITELEKTEVSLDKELPIDFQTKQCPDRSTFFTYITYKLLVAFEEFNFKRSLLHGEVKPPNLVLVKDSSSPCLYEPRIIDFDLTFKLNMEQKPINPPHILYTLTYRSPEIIKFCPTNNCKDEKGSRDPLRKFCAEYVCSREFKEDAYALGATIENILTLNNKKENLNGDLVKYVVQTVIPSLKKDDVKSRSSTRSMRATFEEKL